MPGTQNSQSAELFPVHTLQVRVRYSECDAMGIVHHAVYPIWLEMGRTELCRMTGVSYRELEASGVFLAVVSISLTYRRPARYDDLLSVETRLAGVSRVKLEHTYRVLRDGLELAVARTVLACLDGNGRPRALPDGLGTAPPPGHFEGETGPT